MKVIFPNQKSLQPIPNKDVRPNISGNINSTSNTLPNSVPSENSISNQNNVSPETPKNANDQNFYLIYIILGIIILLITVGTIILKKNINNELEKKVD